MEIHGNDVVSASTCKEVRDQCSGLSDPLSISDLGLKRGRLRSRLPHKTASVVRAVFTIGLVRLAGVRLGTLNTI